MMKGGRGQTNQLNDINWGVLDHASYAPQLMSCTWCNYYNMSTCIHVFNSVVLYCYTHVCL